MSGTPDDEYYTSEVSQTTTSTEHTSTSMSEPSSQDEDIIITRLTQMDIKKGSPAPGPAPNAGELLKELIDDARSMKMSVEPAPPVYGFYGANYYSSEYDGTGPSDPSEEPLLLRINGPGWQCPMFAAYGRAYKGCVLYGTAFPNVGILGLHLSRHHPNLETHWRVDVEVRAFHLDYIFSC